MIKLLVVEAWVFNPLHVCATREDHVLCSHVEADAVAYHRHISGQFLRLFARFARFWIALTVVSRIAVRCATVAAGNHTAVRPLNVPMQLSSVPIREVHEPWHVK
eukprot:COSAG02_NODE_21682_length_779_cov_0.647059_1_plen_104_part_10